MTEALIASLEERFRNIQHGEFRGQLRIEIPSGETFEILSSLKEDYGFDLLVDVTCVDYLQYRGTSRDDAPAGRWGLAYLLANTTTADRITVRVYLDDEDQPTVDSVVPLWEGANWLEREVWDLFGIRFAGHPNLRRILLPDEFSAHPLRKDYPLQGRGERHNFPVIARDQA